MSVRFDGETARLLADTSGAGADEKPLPGSGGSPGQDDKPAQPDSPGTRLETYWVRIDRWHAHYDDRTCPSCMALDWTEYEEDAGPWPPLHAHCRCGREVGARYEARTREVTSSGSGAGARP